MLNILVMHSFHVLFHVVVFAEGSTTEALHWFEFLMH